mgnify:CR=1 FL=1
MRGPPLAQIRLVVPTFSVSSLHGARTPALEHVVEKIEQILEPQQLAQREGQRVSAEQHVVLGHPRVQEYFYTFQQVGLVLRGKVEFFDFLGRVRVPQRAGCMRVSTCMHSVPILVHFPRGALSLGPLLLAHRVHVAVESRRVTTSS